MMTKLSQILPKNKIEKVTFFARLFFGGARQLQGAEEALWASGPQLPFTVNQGVLLGREEVPLHIPLFKHVSLGTTSQNIIGVSLGVPSYIK